MLHKANGDHVTNTHVTSNEKISSSSALSFAVDESERKEKCYLNPAFKHVNQYASEKFYQLLSAKKNVTCKHKVLASHVMICSMRRAEMGCFEEQVSSFEALEEFFEDLEQRFHENDLILENKAMLYSRKPAFCCAFSTRHMRFAYLH